MTLSALAEQRLTTWREMDRLRYDASNWADYSPDAKRAVVIDGPLHVCDQCGGDGYIPNSWDSSSSLHACYACDTRGVTTYPAYQVRKWICEQALTDMARPSWPRSERDDYDLDNGGY